MGDMIYCVHDCEILLSGGFDDAFSFTPYVARCCICFALNMRRIAFRAGTRAEDSYAASALI
jgi:hypothetical protein